MNEWKKVERPFGGEVYRYERNGKLIGQINMAIFEVGQWSGVLRLPGFDAFHIVDDNIDVIKLKMEKLFKEWLELMDLKEIAD